MRVCLFLKKDWGKHKKSAFIVSIVKIFVQLKENLGRENC